MNRPINEEWGAIPQRNGHCEAVFSPFESAKPGKAGKSGYSFSGEDSHRFCKSRRTARFLVCVRFFVAAIGAGTKRKEEEHEKNEQKHCFCHGCDGLGVLSQHGGCRGNRR